MTGAPPCRISHALSSAPHAATHNYHHHHRYRSHLAPAPQTAAPPSPPCARPQTPSPGTPPQLCGHPAWARPWRLEVQNQRRTLVILLPLLPHHHGAVTLQGPGQGILPTGCVRLSTEQKKDFGNTTSPGTPPQLCGHPAHATPGNTARACGRVHTEQEEDIQQALLHLGTPPPRIPSPCRDPH